METCGHVQQRIPAAADQLCTMEMAPRSTVGSVDGAEEDKDVSLKLAGSPEFDNVRIQIYGEN